MRSKVHPQYKTKDRVGNWSAYEQALVQRGNVTLWRSADATAACYEAAEMRDAPGVVPPAKTARGSRRRPRLRARDRTITDVRTRGRRRWKQEAGYQLQARVEHACFRDQSMIGDRLRARSRGGRVAESMIAGHVLNQRPEARSARVVQSWSVTCRWVGIVDGQFRVMHQRRLSLARRSWMVTQCLMGLFLLRSRATRAYGNRS